MLAYVAFDTEKSKFVSQPIHSQKEILCNEDAF